WNALGRMQFDYLVGHGLQPHHRLLDIGCGNLRAGRWFVNYLQPSNYYGVDISSEILFAAQRTVHTYGLREKLRHLTPVADLRFEFLPHACFDVVHAHSVFSHAPLKIVEECLDNVGRILAPGGHSGFTYDRTEGTEHDV